MKISEYDCIYYNQSKDFVRPPLHNIGMTIKTDNHPIAVILIDKDMEKEKKQIELPAELQGKKFRIRKLTPTECLRLMGCDEPTIQKMTSCGLSNSALYKLAGNSIVVDVLFHLFRKMFIETEPDVEKGESMQLSLFD